MKNPLKQLKKVQTQLAAQAYASYCYGYKEGSNDNPRLDKQAFFKKIKDVILEGERLQRLGQGTLTVKKKDEIYTEA